MQLTEETIIPAYQSTPGFEGYMLLTDGEKGVAITLWDSEENRESSIEIAQRMTAELGAGSWRSRRSPRTSR